MTSLLHLYPGDAALAAFLAVFLKVTVVALGLQGLALLARRNAPLRHAFGVAALATLLVGPFLFLAIDGAGLNLVHTELLSRSFPFLNAPEPISPVFAGDQRSGDDRIGSSTVPDVEAALALFTTLQEIGDEGARNFGRKATAALTSGPLFPAAASPEVLHAPPGRVSEAVERSNPRQRFALVASVILLFWLAGVGFGVLRLIHGLAHRRRILRAARPLTAAEVAGADAFTDTKRCPQIFTSRRIGSPVTFGWIRPVIVLPERLVKILTPSQMRAVMAHESAHILRADAVVALLQRLAVILYWPHPLAHSLSRMLSRAREEICDNHVLQLSDRPEYSRVLVLVSKLLAGRPATSQGLCLLARRWSLADRVAGVLDERRKTMTRIKPRSRITLFFVTLALLFLASTVSAFSGGGGKGDGSDDTASQAIAEEKKEKNNKNRSRAKEISDALKNLQKLSTSLESLGYVDQLASLQDTASRLERLLAKAEAEEAEAQLEQKKAQIALYRAAIDAHVSAGHDEEAVTLENAVGALRVDGRKDDEAKAIRKHRPKKQVQAALLADAAARIRESGDLVTAEQLDALADSLDRKRNGEGRNRNDKQGGRANGKNEADDDRADREKAGRNHNKNRNQGRKADGRGRKGHDDNKGAHKIEQLEKQLEQIVSTAREVERKLAELRKSESAEEDF